MRKKTMIAIFIAIFLYIPHANAQKPLYCATALAGCLNDAGACGILELACDAGCYIGYQNCGPKAS
jgi:hypothetical protein